MKHKLQKKAPREEDIHKVVTQASETLNKWTNDPYYLGAERAIRGFGKYRLSENYKDFYRTPDQRNHLTKKQKEDLVENFFQYVPNPLLYDKPKSAGLKHNSEKNKIAEP